PEVVLHYGEQLTLALHLPPRHSDALAELAGRYFDEKGLWKGGDDYAGLVAAIEHVPEPVTVFSDALEFIDRAEERREMRASERGITKVLVVAPASVKYQWDAEIRKFTDRPVQVIDGTIEERKSQYTQPTFYRLVNYEQATRDLDALNAWQPDLVIVDEAQRIK